MQGTIEAAWVRLGAGRRLAGGRFPVVVVAQHRVPWCCLESGSSAELDVEAEQVPALPQSPSQVAVHRHPSIRSRQMMFQGTVLHPRCGSRDGHVTRICVISSATATLDAGQSRLRFSVPQARP